MAKIQDTDAPNSEEDVQQQNSCWWEYKMLVTLEGTWAVDGVWLTFAEERDVNVTYWMGRCSPPQCIVTWTYEFRVEVDVLCACISPFLKFRMDFHDWEELPTKHASSFGVPLLQGLLWLINLCTEMPWMFSIGVSYEKAKVDIVAPFGWHDSSLSS